MPCFGSAVIRASLDVKAWEIIKSNAGVVEAIRQYLQTKLQANVTAARYASSVTFNAHYGLRVQITSNGIVVESYDPAIAETLAADLEKLVQELAVTVQQQEIARLLEQMAYMESDVYETDQTSGLTQRVITLSV